MAEDAAQPLLSSDRSPTSRSGSVRDGNLEGREFPSSPLPNFNALFRSNDGIPVSRPGTENLRIP